MGLSERWFKKTLENASGIKKIWLLLRYDSTLYSPIVSRGIQNEHRLKADIDRAFVILVDHFYYNLHAILVTGGYETSYYNDLAAEIENDSQKRFNITPYIYGMAISTVVCTMAFRCNKKPNVAEVKKTINEAAFEASIKEKVDAGLSLAFDLYSDERFSPNSNLGEYALGSWELSAISCLFFGIRINRPNYGGPQLSMAMYQTVMETYNLLPLISREEEFIERRFIS